MSSSSSRVRGSSSTALSLLPPPLPLARPPGFEELSAARTIEQASLAVIAALQRRRHTTETGDDDVPHWTSQYLQHLHVVAALAASDMGALPELTFDSYIDAVDLRKMVGELVDILRRGGSVAAAGRERAKAGDENEEEEEEAEGLAVFDEVVRRVFMLSTGHASSSHVNLIASKSRIALQMLCAPSAAANASEVASVAGGVASSVCVTANDINCMLRVFGAIISVADTSGVDKWIVDSLCKSFRYIVTESLSESDTACDETAAALYELIFRYKSDIFDKAVERSLTSEVSLSSFDPVALHGLLQALRVDRQALLVPLLIVHFVRGGLGSVNKLMNYVASKARAAISERSSQLFLRCISFVTLCQVALRLSKISFISDTETLLHNWCVYLFSLQKGNENLGMSFDINAKKSPEGARVAKDQGGSEIGDEIEFICRSFIAATEFFDIEMLNNICLALKPIRSYNTAAIDELIAIVSQSSVKSAPPGQASMPELNADRLRSWAATIARTQALPPAVAQFCQFQGPMGYKSVIARMNMLMDLDESLVPACDAIIRMMVTSKPPVCSQSEYEAFVTQRDRKRIANELISFCKKGTEALPRFVVDSTLVQARRVFDALIELLSSVGNNSDDKKLSLEISRNFHVCASLPAELPSTLSADWDSLQARIATVIVSAVIRGTAEEIVRLDNDGSMQDLKIVLPRLGPTVCNLFRSAAILSAFVASFLQLDIAKSRKWEVPKDGVMLAYIFIIATIDCEAVQKFCCDVVKCCDGTSNNMRSCILFLAYAINSKFMHPIEGLTKLEEGEQVAKKQRIESSSSSISENFEKIRNLKAFLSCLRSFVADIDPIFELPASVQVQVENILRQPTHSDSPVEFDELITRNSIEWIMSCTTPANNRSRPNAIPGAYFRFIPGRTIGVREWSAIAQTIVRLLTDSLKRYTKQSNSSDANQRTVKIFCAVVIGDLFTGFPREALLTALNSFMSEYLAILFSSAESSLSKDVAFFLAQYTITDDFAMGMAVAQGSTESIELLKHYFYSKYVLNCEPHLLGRSRTILNFLHPKAHLIIECASIEYRLWMLKEESPSWISLPFDQDDMEAVKVLSWAHGLSSTGFVADLSPYLSNASSAVCWAVPSFIENASTLLFSHRFPSHLKIGLSLGSDCTTREEQVETICAQAETYGSLLGRQIRNIWTLDIDAINQILHAFKDLLSLWRSSLDSVPCRPMNKQSRPDRGLGTNLSYVACVAAMTSLAIYPRSKDAVDLTIYNKMISTAYEFLMQVIQDLHESFDETSLVDCVLSYRNLLPNIALERAVAAALGLGKCTPDCAELPDFNEDEIRAFIASRISVAYNVL